MPLTPEKVSGAAEDGDYGTALSLAVALYLQDGNVDPLIKTYDAILRGAVRSRLVEAPPTRKGVVEAQKLGVKEGIDEIVRLEKMIAPLARAIRKAHKKEVVHALKYHIPIED
jgi:transposase